MKYKCCYCNKQAKRDNSIEYKKELFVHVNCIKSVEENMFSGIVSLNKEILIGDELVELISLLPDTAPSTPRLGMDLRLVVSMLHKKGKTQESKALQYFIDGLNQTQMASKFKRNRQRISQIVVSLRKELVKLGINELGYCK